MPADPKPTRKPIDDRSAGPAEGPAEAPPPLPFPVVGIGASAGGLSALEALFDAMPESPGMAFVVVQHLSPDNASVLVELLQRHTALPVVQVTDGMAVAVDRVHVIPPGADLALSDGVLHLTPPAAPRGHHLSIDHFLRSLARAQRERAVAIVLSGTGSDGALGARAVKGEGGLVLAQTPESAEYEGMPRAAVATGMVDLVLDPARMPQALVELVAKRPAADAPDRPTLHDPAAVRKICALLLAQTGHDFSQYKATTLVRRMERRMALAQITDTDEYLRHARENPHEVEALFRDLLIGVTHFFRDADAFRVLEQQVIPRLVETKPAQGVLRVWVCACSTGEEAYSLAILLHERIQQSAPGLRLQVFATDIDAHAIEAARAGVFPDSIAADVPAERLARHFTHDPQLGLYRVRKHIRDLLVFSEQDVTRDPPFSRLDLVSCRNLLIYLNTEVQQRLIPLFHYALLPGGVLFLGTSETVGDSARLYTVIDRKWKLFARLAADEGGSRLTLPDFVPPPPEAALRRERIALPAAADETSGLRRIAEQALIAHYAQAAVLVNERGQILHILGRTGKFLEPADGDAALNILPMAREGLKRELTVALHRAVGQQQPVAFNGLRVKANGHWIVANLVVRPVETSPGNAPSMVYLVVLEEAPNPPVDGPAGDATGAGGSERVLDLERELRAKDEYLQTTLEEMETTNEELKSTNEELQSVNEELQSTNEELETSKEELQSVNEELSTVNAELQDKVADLSRANNDMNNLLAGTGVGTVFVDHHLRIARFTPAATQVINLIPGDVGRPLEHVASNLVGYDRLIDDIRSVLDTLVPKEAEVQVRGSGAWYLMRIRPYRTMENLIEGAVVTLVDISERKKAEQSLRLSEARLHGFIHQAFAGVGELDGSGRLLFVNDRLCQMLGYTRDELLAKRIQDITDPQDVTPLEDTLLRLATGGPEAHLLKRFVRRDGVRLRTHDRLSAIRDQPGGPLVSLLMLSFTMPDG